MSFILLPWSPIVVVFARVEGGIVVGLGGVLNPPGEVIVNTSVVVVVDPCPIVIG